MVLYVALKKNKGLLRNMYIFEESDQIRSIPEIFLRDGLNLKFIIQRQYVHKKFNYKQTNKHTKNNNIVHEKPKFFFIQSVFHEI